MDSGTRRKFISTPTQSTTTVTLFPSSGITSSRPLVSQFQTGQIDELVNNESSEIIRIFNSAFDEFLDEKHAKRDFYPEPLRGKIHEINEWVYDNFNNGVYKVSIFKMPSLTGQAGFASVQAVCALLHPRRC